MRAAARLAGPARRAVAARAAASTTTLAETDLAQPLCDWLAAQGFIVRSEVKDCDIAAVRGEELLIVEMKKTLNLTLVVQAVQRQRMTDTVYVAVPRPPSKWKWWKESRGVFHLLRRLELGLILASPGKEGHSNGGPPVDVIFPPRPLARRRRAPSRRAVLAEISGRVADFNRAGSTRTKLVTAYRENAVHVACWLLSHGAMAPAALRARGTGPKTQSILQYNPYGWFERVEKGLYALSARGRQELADYPELVRHYRAIVKRRKAS
jgi:hypothetical protein